MKLFLLAFFVAAVAAAPTPLDDDNQAVELIVNGVAEGEPLELGGIVDIKLKEHADGQLVASSDLLHPLTAVGIAEAAAVAAAEAAAAEAAAAEAATAEIAASEVTIVETAAEETEVINIPVPIVLPEPVAPEVAPEIPEPVVLPNPVLPVVVIPEPEVAELHPVVPVLPEVIVEPVVPEVTEEITAPVLPEPVVQPSNEIFNNGIVQVQVNAPEPSVFSTIQSWFSLIVNYFNDGVQASHQIV